VQLAASLVLAKRVPNRFPPPVDGTGEFPCQCSILNTLERVDYQLRDAEPDT
jgi:hypothetical protein